VAGVLLAAGTSSRMGRNKLLLALDGESVLRRAARTAIEAGLDPLLVVVGHERQRAEAELAGLCCTTVFNERYAEGMHTSLRRGFEALPAGIVAGVVLLADMPRVTAAQIGALVAGWRPSGAPLAITLYDDVIAPPALYAAPLFAELRALEGEGCGKKVIQRHRAEALEVRVHKSALADLDVPADLELHRAGPPGGE
jgi:molybdenum cofactor cytidylyltransferase